MARHQSSSETRFFFACFTNWLLWNLRFLSLPLSVGIVFKRLFAKKLSNKQEYGWWITKEFGIYSFEFDKLYSPTKAFTSWNAHSFWKKRPATSHKGGAILHVRSTMLIQHAAMKRFFFMQISNRKQQLLRALLGQINTVCSGICLISRI